LGNSPDDYSGEYMKNIQNALEEDNSGGSEDKRVNRLIVRPLAGLIRRQGLHCLAQGTKILAKLQEVQESIDVIAREIARGGKRDE